MSGVTHSEDEEVHEPIVHLAVLEHALRSNGAPDN